MRAAGKTNRETAKYFGLEVKQIKNWVTRHNHEQERIKSGEQLRPKGGPRKDGQLPHQSEQKELERLRMENKLLRDFLQLTGRK